MELTKNQWLGLGGVAALVGYLLWSKKASAAPSATTVKTPATPAGPSAGPPGTPTVSPGYDVKIPEKIPEIPGGTPSWPSMPGFPGYPAIPGYPAPTPASLPTTPADASAKSDEYKRGFSDGGVRAMDAPAKGAPIPPPSGYPSNEYKKGYEDGWNQYMVYVTGVHGPSHKSLKHHSYVSGSWWNLIPSYGSLAEYGMWDQKKTGKIYR